MNYNSQFEIGGGKKDDEEFLLLVHFFFVTISMILFSNT